MGTETLTYEETCQRIGMVARPFSPFSDISGFIAMLLERTPKFTGQLEINFKDGILKDIYEKKRTKFKLALRKN